MRGIISSSLRQRTLVIAVAALFLGFGVWQLRNASLDSVPEFSPLTLTVKTEALGLSNTEVEALVTVPLEADLLNGVPWLRSIESESMAGVSTIRMLFNPGTDLMHARQMVQERLVQAPTGLPNVSSPPVLLQPVSSAHRIMNIGFSSSTVSLIDMTIQAHWNIVPRLVGVPGVANVSIWGRRDRQLQVQVAPEALHQRGITLEQVVKTAGEAVFASPLTYLTSSTPGSGGFIDTPNQRLNIRHVSPLVTPEQLARLPIIESSLTLGQIASVVEGHQPLIGDAIIRGGAGILLAVDKLPGFNTQEVTRGIEKALEEMRPGLAGIDIDTQIYRPAGFLEQATARLATALVIACALLALSLLLLLQGWRLALIALVAIPLSLLVAWQVLRLRGVPLTTIGLAGLLMALGVVVHDAILDVNTIARRLRQARTAGAAAVPARTILAAALEARRPMLFATLVLLLAVAPMLFTEGRFADLLRPVVWTCIAAILASMAVALTVTPALSAMLLSRAVPAAPQGVGLIGRLQAPVERHAGAALRSPMAAFGIATVAALISLVAWSRLERDLSPGFRETDILVAWRGPEGIALPEMTRLTASLTRELRALPGVRNTAAHIGRAVLCNCDEAEDVNSAAVWVSLDPRADYDRTIEAIRAMVAEYPGMRSQVGSYLSRKVRDAIAEDSERLAVRVYGQDQDILRGKAEEVRKLVAQLGGVAGARVESPPEETTIEVEVNLVRAGTHGLKPGDVRRATASLVGGITVGSLYEQQKVFDVVVWGAPDIRRSIADVQDLLLETENGTPVRLAEVADVRLAPTTSAIRRHGALRRLDVEVDISGRPVGAVAREITEHLKGMPFPLEYHARVLGGHLETRSALRSTEAYAVAAAVLAFLLLQAVFGSWRLAAVSLLGLPVAALGSIAAVFLDGRVISLGSILGCAAVLGLTLRIGIAMFAHFQVLEREGMPFGEELVRHGVRDCLPSTLATLVAVGAVTLPFIALGMTAGLEVAHPAAVAMLGGLAGTAAATLFLMPALYLRFGAGTAADRLDLGPAPDPEPAPH